MVKRNKKNSIYLYKLKNFTKNITAFALIAGLTLAGFVGAIPALAGAVTVSISPSTALVSVTGAITLSFTNAVSLPVGSSIIIIYPNTYTGTTTTANTTINGAAPTTAVSAASGASNTMVTLTNATLITAPAAITIGFSGLTTPSVIGNYSFTMSTNKGDFGAVLQYIGDANAVNVTAFVPLSLSFAIRDNSDAVNTNICDMGTLATTAIGSCIYRLKIGTNATNGYVVSMLASGNFTNGTSSFTNAAVGAAGTTIAAGTETYGIFATAGAVTGTPGTIALATAYGTSAGNVVSYNNTTSATLATATGPNAPGTSGDVTNTISINHRAAIGANTRAGVYNQKVTYTVVANF